MNHTTFPAFPPPYGTWYSRWAAIYTTAPTDQPTTEAAITVLPSLPRLTTAA